mgnify:CR=1 FL=1
MSVASDLIRGHTDTIILSLLIIGDSYGYKINKDIMRLTGNRFEFKEATLYSAFRRLEQAGLIVSYWGEEAVGANTTPSPMRDGSSTKKTLPTGNAQGR